MSSMSMSGSEIAFFEICPILVESNGKLQILKQETGNFFIFVRNLMQVLNLLVPKTKIGIKITPATVFVCKRLHGQPKIHKFV